jgi:hypothetical protein
VYVRAVTEAEEARQAARAAVVKPQAVVDKLAGELAECRRRAAEAKLAADDDDLDARLQARVMRNSYAEEVTALEERVRLANRICDPCAVAVADAERKLTAARGRLARHEADTSEPFASDAGCATPPYKTFVGHSGLWIESDSAVTRELVMGWLRRSGVGEEIERRAVEAYLAGNPALQAIGGTKRFPDGSTLINPPGAPPVVLHGQATPGDLATAPVVPVTPGPSGAAVAGGMRHAMGWPAPPEAVHKAGG